MLLKQFADPFFTHSCLAASLAMAFLATMPDLTADHAARFAAWLPARCGACFATAGVGIGGVFASDRRRLQSLVAMRNWGIAKPTATHWLKWVTIEEFRAARPQDPPDQAGPPVDGLSRELVVRDIISTTELVRRDARSH